MAENQTSIIIKAVDQTEGALKSVQTNLGALEGQFNRLSGVVSGFAALAGVTAFAGIVKGAVDSAAALHDMSQSTGASVESLSAMRGAAKMAGVDMDQVATGLSKLSKNMVEAAQGSGDAARVFSALGVSVTDSAGKLKSSDTVMLEFAKSLQTVGSSTERAAAAQMVLGKNGAALMPMLNDLAVAGELQAKITTAQAAAADELQDNLTKLATVGQSWKTTIAMEIVPAANAFVEALLEVSTRSDGTKRAAKELAADGSIKTWAIDAAKAASFVVDAMDGVVRVAKITSMSIAGIAKDLQTLGEVALYAAGAGFTQEGQAAIKAALRDRQAFIAAMNEDLQNTLMKEQFSDVLARRIAAIGTASTEAAAGPRNLSAALKEAGKSADDTAKKLENLRNAQLGRIAKQASAELDAIAKQNEDYAKALAAGSVELERQAVQLEQQVEFYGMTESAIQNTIVARLEEARAIAESNGAYPEHLAFLDREIEARKRIASAASQKEVLDANERAAKAATREWEKFADDIGRSLTDALFRAFESGNSFGQAFAKNLENTLKSMVLKFVIQSAVTTGSNLLNSGLNAVFGMGASNGGKGVNYLGLANDANSIYNLGRWATGTYTALTTGAGAIGGTAQLASAYGAMGGDSLGAFIAMNPQWGMAGASGTAAAGTTAAGSTAAGSTAAAGGTASAAGWSSALSTVGIYAAAALVGYKIGEWLGGKMFGGGVSSTGSGIQGTFTYDGYENLADYVNMHKSGGWFKSGKSWTNTYSMDQGRRDAYLDAIRSFADPYKALDLVAGGTTGIINERGAGWRYSFKTAAGGEQALLQNAAENLGQRVAPELVKFQKSGEKLYETAARMIEVVQATNVLASVLGKDLRQAFGSLGITSIDVRQSVVEATGGMEQFTNEVGYFYENFRSQAEKTFDSNNAMRMSFTSLGVSMPTTIEGFRNLVKSMDLTTEWGRYAFASLMDLQGGFKAWVDATESANQAIKSLRISMAENGDQFKLLLRNVSDAFVAIGQAVPTTKSGFMALLDSLDMTTLAGVRTREALLNVSGSFSQLIDNITSQLAALEQQRLALAQQVVGERDNLVSAILTALGKVSTLRQIEIERTDPLNRDLAIFSYALTDAAQAAQALTQAQSAAIQAQEQAISRLAGAGSGIANFVAQLRAGLNGRGTTGTLDAYNADLLAAQKGDLAASERLPGSAGAYAQTLRDTSRSQFDLDIALSRMAGELSALPATQTYAAQQLAETIALQAAVTNSAAALKEQISIHQRALADVLTSGFAAFDLNVDRLLTFDELKTGLAGLATDEQIKALIATVDKNGDGQISQLELLQYGIGEGLGKLQGALVNGFAGLDLNLDSVLTFDELKTGLAGLATDVEIRKLISAVDLNGDGQISQMEAVKSATQAVDGNTLDLVDGSNTQIIALRSMVAETITNSGRLMELNASIKEMTNAVSIQNEAKRIETEIANKNLALEGMVKQQQGMVASVNAGIAGIWSLANQYGVYLQANSGDSPTANTAQFYLDANNQFKAAYSQIGGYDSANFQPFKNDFYSAGGVYDQTYGMADDLQAIYDQINAARAAIIALGGVPKFATGGDFLGGLRIVGENGPELQATGPARIYNAEQTRRILSGGAMDAPLFAMLAELRALRAQVERQEAAMAAVAGHTYKTARKLEEVVGDGILVRTETGYPLETVTA